MFLVVRVFSNDDLCLTGLGLASESESWFQSFLVSWCLVTRFQNFLVSWFQRFLVSKFVGFEVSWFLVFKVSKI